MNLHRGPEGPVLEGYKTRTQLQELPRPLLVFIAQNAFVPLQGGKALHLKAKHLRVAYRAQIPRW